MKLRRRQFLHLAVGAAALSALRGSHERKPIHRGQSAGWLASFRVVRPTLLRG